MANEIQKVPKVFILGVQRSGKTVFLSVLGMKFMLVEYGGIAAPLGFRLEPQDEDTVNLVRKKYAELQQGHWPGSTSERDMTRLRWTVYTGGRPIFDLATMDCSGEQIRKAFAVSAGGWGDSPSVSDSDTVADALLSSGGAESGVGEFRVEEIREAVKEASLVCLFVNAADYPAGAAGAALRKNFEDTVDTFWRLLKQDTDLANKSLLVLTQTHLVRETIENMGGPSLYLCARGAQHLQQVVSQRKIPIISISAVNQTGWENDVPNEINSDGLFGFLLTVGGIVAGEKDTLCTLKDRYLDFLRLRDEFSRQLAIRSVLTERFQVLKEFITAADSFREGCLKYVDDAKNMNQPRPQILYRTATEQDHDVKDADEKWRSRLKVDEVWMRQVLKLIGRQTSVQLGDNEVLSLVDTVKREASVTFDPNLYGFDANIGNGIDSLEWVRQSVSLVSTELADDKRALETGVPDAENTLAQLCGKVGTDGFIQSAKDLEAKCESLERHIDRFRTMWLAYGYNAVVAQCLDDSQKKCRGIRIEIEKLRSRNKLVEEERCRISEKLCVARKEIAAKRFSAARRALCEVRCIATREPFSPRKPDAESRLTIRQVEEELAAALRVCRIRRFRVILKYAMLLLVLAGVGYGGYRAAERYCDGENRRIAGEIESLLRNPEAVRANDWGEVRERVGNLWSFPLLSITPENYVRNDLLSRLYDSGLCVDRIRRTLKQADEYCVAFTNAIGTIQRELQGDYRTVFCVCTNFSQYAEYPDFKRLNASEFQYPIQEKEIAEGERWIGEASRRLQLRQLLGVAEKALESLDAQIFDGAANQADKLVATPDETRKLALLRQNFKERSDVKRREEEAYAEQERKRIESEWKERLNICESLLKQAQAKSQSFRKVVDAGKVVHAVQECQRVLSQISEQLPPLKNAASAQAKRIREIQTGMEDMWRQLPYIVEVVAYSIRSGGEVCENIGLPLSSTGNDRCVEIDPETKCSSVYLVIPEKDVGSDKIKVLAIRRNDGKIVRSYYSLHGLVHGINRQKRIIERE